MKRSCVLMMLSLLTLRLDGGRILNVFGAHLLLFPHLFMITS